MRMWTAEQQARQNFCQMDLLKNPLMGGGWHLARQSHLPHLLAQ